MILGPNFNSPVLVDEPNPTPHPAIKCFHRLLLWKPPADRTVIAATHEQTPTILGYRQLYSQHAPPDEDSPSVSLHNLAGMCPRTLAPSSCSQWFEPLG